MDPQSIKLKNGLRVILIDTKAFPTMTAILLVGAGSRFENEKNNGIAHFFEHMVFKGSKKYPNFFMISSILEGMGAYHNAFTGKDHTGYWVKAPTKYFSKVIDVISDMVLNPLLKQDEIEREKGVIVEEINMYEDQPQRRVGEYFEELLYKGNPLGFNIAGKKETVVKFRRDIFSNYIDKLYFPENAVLVVAGGLGKIDSIGNFTSVIEDKFAGWSGSKNNIADSEKIIKVNEKQESPKMLIINKKTEQTHFCIGYRAFSFSDSRRYTLSVLGTVLGGGSSSRLFIEVRERRGLCYYISTGRELYSDAGYMVTQAGVTNNLEKNKETVKVILGEHRKIAQGKLTPEELNRAKEIIKGRLLLSLEDSENVATLYGVKALLENRIEPVEKIISNIDKVSGSEVVDLAKQIFKPEKLNLALIGPFVEKDFKNVLDY